MIQPVAFSLLGLLVLPLSVQAAEFSSEQLCKAAISLDMGRPVSIMTTERTGSEPQISYMRDDGDYFLYKCRIRGNRVAWAAYFSETNSWGRWRDGEWDPVLTFKEEGGRLLLHSSETGVTKEYNLHDF